MPIALEGILPNKAIQLYQRQDVNHAAALAIWRNGLAAAGASDDLTLMPYVDHYLRVAPNDEGMKTHKQDLLKLLEAQRQLEADPYYQMQQRGLAALAQGHLSEAEKFLQGAAQHRGKEPEVLGGFGLLRMHQGQSDAAINYFREAKALSPPSAQDRWDSLIKTAHFWGLLTAADQARAAGDNAGAEQHIRAALSMQPHGFVRQDAF